MRHRSASLRRLAVLAAAIAVLGIALGTRLLAVSELGVDFDEDDYLRAGQLYATGLQAGDPSVFLRENYRPEHPPLSKIAVGLALAGLPPAPEIPDQPTTAPPARDLPEPHLTTARQLNAAFGAATAFLLALVSPFAGLWLAVHTWSIKYTSQVMLEAVPAFFALAAVILSTRAWQPGTTRRRRVAWLAGAGIAFGLACAGKYLYGVAGLAILLDWLLRLQAEAEATGTRPEPSPGERLRAWVRRLRPLGGWILLALAVFVLADPYLWPDPIGRLASSIAYHGGYATSDAVAETGWPMWQPLVWLSGSVPIDWQDPATFVVAIDLVISALALTGLRRLWAERRVYALWLLIALAFLLAWPTKWPQYVLILSAPLCLSAGLATEGLASSAVRAARRLLGREPRPVGERRRRLRELRIALPWLTPGLLALLILGIVPLIYQAMLAVTDMQLSSLKDGLTGGVVREAVGGVTGQIAATDLRLDMRPKEVSFVGLNLIAAIQQGVSMGGNTSASFLAFSTLWMALALACQATLGIAVALVLERPGVRFAAAWRTLFILPWAIPEVVGAIAWQDVFHPQQGLIAKLAQAPVPWNESPEWSLVVLLIAATWMGWPLWMLVATAGLRTIPRSVHEAAELEGASAWRRFRSVTLPLLLPLLSAALVVRGIAAFNQFYLFWIVNPNGNDITLPVWTYSMVRFDPFLYSVSAAVNIVTVVALGVVVAWFLRWRGRAERVAFA
ncbi:MAG: ABC transporter permease subunit [Chloroflexota bacterium]